jgi:branched-chain amino acid transport system ATP-binding protein
VTVLELRGVTAGYGSADAVRDLDLTVAAGEVLALLGPNGAGKTTTLKTAIGLIRPRSGEVLALGRAVDRRVDRTTRSGVVLVPDSRAIFSGLSVRDNLRLAARRGGPKWDSVLERLPRLSPLVDRRVGLLSGGEQQMLALAKALLCRPRVLLVDELSLGLAPVAVQELLPVVRALADDLGVGVLLVEQHVDLALGVSDRAMVLHHGRTAMEATAAELRADRDAVHRAYFGADERSS